jgi:acyl-CoA thioesterase I
MVMYYKSTVAPLVLLLSALILSNAATAQLTPNFARPRSSNETPKVVFIGDQFTYMWGTTAPFTANSNWINQGWDAPVSTYCFLSCSAGTSAATLARFQTDVIDLHPAIVHIMVGVDDLANDDDATQAIGGVDPGFSSNLGKMVTMAKAANIQVILGIESTQWASATPPFPQAINAIVAGLGAQNNIQVINYADALCQCVSSTGGVGSGGNGSVQYMVAANMPVSALTPTAAGYALMSQMAEVAILSTLGQIPGGGYLQNVEPSEQEDQPSVTNVNTGLPGNVYQFIPYGWYNNGLVEPFVNGTFAGSSGTWASSNPLVMSVSQTGVVWALSPGTAAITYTSPSGVKFNEWIMYIGAF